MRILKNEPLVSVGVISYNSHEYIIEALESVKRQSYSNIELIVSDDCSPDNSVEIAKDWVKKNGGRFFNAVVLTTDKNTGVTGNCQRILDYANGKWLKLFAHDDVLADDAIESYVRFAENNPDSHVQFGMFSNFTEDINTAQKKIYNLANIFFKEGITAEGQMCIMSKMFVGSGPGFFSSVESLRISGGYDLRFPMQEDYAMFLRLLKNGYKMYLNPSITIYKRNVPTSIMHDQKEKSFYSKNVCRQIMEYKYLYQFENMSPFWQKMLKLSLKLQTNVVRSGNNKQSLKCWLYYCIQRCFDPMRWTLLYMTLLNRFMKPVF